MPEGKQLFIQNHSCPEKLLHKKFKYPDFYFEYLYFDYLESKKTLSISTLSYLNQKEITSWYKSINKGFWFQTKLIPFACDDEDGLFCFHGKDSSRIFSLDLSAKDYFGSEILNLGFLSLINSVRIDNGLDVWEP
jgi:hypothetical protein